ncbi:hypothetical protein [Bremerella alba]|uniref:Carboxypeptidase regulatory-like domain-containing protein n=1 Tax=Bremerella alba TaxID=980252 RepID=A0A7V8V1T0_9BACT|nr:hypothetical protein [Bremerella alba]MBA2113296.1 hypothetical protein [Bremerella alba]
MKTTAYATGVVVCCLLVLGCTKSDGLERHKLSGTVTYDGQPVPQGEIQFTPNSREGNPGPGTFIKIENGHYETPSGKGVLGGAYGVRIVGYDGKANTESDMGVSLFNPYSERIDLPKEDSTRDFQVSKR